MVTALVFAGKAVAAPAISFLVTKAFNYLDKYRKSEGMEEVKSRLLLAVPKIQAVFDVVNPERVREQSSALDAWLWQLRDAVEEAEDAVDELEYHELEEKAKERKVSDWGSSFAKMKHEVVRSVKHVTVLDKIRKKFTNRDTLKRLMKAVDGLDKAAAGVAGFLTLTDHLNGGASSSQQQAQLLDSDRETGSTLSATTFVGREKEKKQIIGWLTNTSVESAEIVTSTNTVPIISVVGHGGMGKTTLAQSICEEDEVLKHFKVIWVTVSTSFDATSVTSKILECVTGEKPSASHLEPLQQDLKEKLKSLNFLLVLDDVWEDKKRDEWEKLFAPLRMGKNGSKILLTTRMQSVADMAAKVMGIKTECLTVGGLEEGENLELFNHHVFSGLNPQDYVHLKLIGEQIAKKLGGCPLVTKVVGGHLQGKITTPEYWSRFLHEGLEHLKGTEEDIMRVLKISYYHLPTELQICFRYCSLFPEDHQFRRKDLVQMWMGSGLISHATSDFLTFEDIGEQFLAQLTRKSFFDLKSRVVYDGTKEEYYVMHDLMHELARNVSSGECARITDPAMFEKEHTIRHLCIANIHSFSVDEFKKVSLFKNLRSIIFDDEGLVVGKDIVCALEKIVESSKSLRLFHSRLANTFHFTDKFGKLKHLRYIRLYQMSPEGICGVVKLYHLMLLHCINGLQRESKQVRYLGNLELLRYVSYGFDGFGEFPVSRLTFLQELNNYRLQGSIGSRLSAIGSLRGLRTLEVQGLENVENHEEAKNAMLKEKQHLNSLSLGWSALNGTQNRTDDLVLDYLEPHGNIRELQISGYEGLKLPSWIENLSVKNLVSLELRRCLNWEYLPSLGELVLLIHLVLVNLPKVKQIGTPSCSSSMELLLPPGLETLVVSKCQELSELPILPPSLVLLRIADAGLTKLPMVGNILSENSETKLSKLQQIIVVDCSCLTSLEGSLLEQKLYMGALRDLQIQNCVHLESAAIPFEEMNGLTDLVVSNCPKLRTTRDANDKLLPSSLTQLIMAQCGDLELALLGSLRRLTNLSYLVLENCSGVVSLPSADVFKSLLSLRGLKIIGCENLLSLGGLGSCTSLVTLDIVGCTKLAESSLTRDASGGEEEGHLLQIQRLEIDLPSLLLVEPLKSLCHTQDLVIWDGREMESLPERWLLQNRASLRYLDIKETKSLESLPPIMRNLSSLEDLSLSGAGQLESLADLPSSLKRLELYGAGQLQSLADLPSSLEKLTLLGAGQLQSLPDLPSSLKRLELYGAGQLQSLAYLPSSLQYLRLWECNSELEKKSREYGRPEWNNISHIPLVEIGHSCFSMGKQCSEETYLKLWLSNHNTLTSWANQQKDDKKLHWWKKQCCLENAS